jgi:hypothetical protein
MSHTVDWRYDLGEDVYVIIKALIKVWSFSVLSIRKDSGSFLAS